MLIRVSTSQPNVVSSSPTPNIIQDNKQFLEIIKNSPSVGYSDYAQYAKDGLWLEFGVAKGRTINILASLTTSTVYGFDSFEGLPEQWRMYPPGKFKCEVPEVPANVQLIQGLFHETLPSFLDNHPGPVALLHIDCDLYSSTKTVFDALKSRFVDGSIIIFDELVNYKGWEQHEYKAFVEFIQDIGYGWQCIGRHGPESVGFRLTI